MDKEKLLAHIKCYEEYPTIIDNDTVQNCQLLREVTVDLYGKIDKGEDIVAYSRLLYYPQPSSSAVLTLSTSLYGYYTEDHIQLRSEEKEEVYYPLFLSISNIKDSDGKLYFIDNNNIKVEFQLGYEHSPIDSNYWHYELFAKDKGSSKKIDISIRPKSNYKKAADRIVSYIMSDCIAKKNELVKFRTDFFDSILKDK